jgi:hypothetical protein
MGRTSTENWGNNYKIALNTLNIELPGGYLDYIVKIFSTV